jgi:hypothetical protein
MPRKSDIQRLIRTPFTAKEWETLMKNKEFADAVQRADSNHEAEGLMTLGARILDETIKGSEHPSPKPNRKND